MTSAANPRHVGRPRDPELDHAILQATLKELHEHGYVGFALEGVASRAHTTKPTVARRWRRRQELIITALATVLVQPPIPDTGCSQCDLIEGVGLFADALLSRMPPGVLAPLIADCASDPELHRRLHDELLQPPHRSLAHTVRRAVDRGDLREDTDPELLVELLASVVFQSDFRMGTQFDAQRAAELVDMVLRGVAVDFEASVEHGEAASGQVHHRHT